MICKIKQLHQAVQKIKYAYTKGLIAYPRVANNYKKEIDFYEAPHPPLVCFDEFSLPLDKKEYPLTKNTVCLELTNVNISTPATLVRNFEVIDKYFDDNMKPIVGMLGDLNKKISSYYQHIEYLESTQGGIMDDGDIKLSECVKDGSSAIIDMELTPFAIYVDNDGEDNRKEKKYIKDDVKNIKRDENKERLFFHNIDEAMEAYIYKKRLLVKLSEEEILKESKLNKGMQ